MMTETEGHGRESVGQRTFPIKVAIAVSLFVCVVELGLGFWFSLESLLAEGAHTLLDGLDSLIVLFAVLVAAKPADRSHPFGHGKFEALGATIEGSFVLAAGIGIAYRSMERLIRGQAPAEIPLFVCMTMGLAALLYLAVSIYLMRIARRSGSPALLAEALHLRSHIYITAGIGGGLLVGNLGNWPIADTLLAIGVSTCLIGISVKIFREVLRQFTDEALPAEDLNTLGGIIERFKHDFMEVHGMRTRRVGTDRHVEMHMVFLPETTVSEAHAVSHTIEDAIREEWPAVRIVVHIEPVNLQHVEAIKGQSTVRVDDDSPDEREFIH